MNNDNVAIMRLIFGMAAVSGLMFGATLSMAEGFSTLNCGFANFICSVLDTVRRVFL